jgi:hypothetical protein
MAMVKYSAKTRLPSHVELSTNPTYWRFYTKKQVQSKTQGLVMVSDNVRLEDYIIVYCHAPNYYSEEVQDNDNVRLTLRPWEKGFRSISLVNQLGLDRNTDPILSLILK